MEGGNLARPLAQHRAPAGQPTWEMKAVRRGEHNGGAVELWDERKLRYGGTLVPRDF